MPTGHRCSPAQRAKAVEFARNHVSQGGSVRQAALMLGVGASSLHGWINSEKRRGAMRPVLVVDASPPPTLVLHGPGGVRVEGLSLGELAELLRRLG